MNVNQIYAVIDVIYRKLSLEKDHSKIILEVGVKVVALFLLWNLKALDKQRQDQ